MRPGCTGTIACLLSDDHRLDYATQLPTYAPCPACAHGISRRCASATAANSTMPSMLSHMSAAQASALSSCELAVSSRLPNPLTEPTNSPITAPMTASVTATLAPEKMNGSAAGNCTLANTWRGDARSARASSRSPGGVARNPVAVSTTIGKNATRNAIASLDSMPRPNQTRRMGAMATFGTDWVATSMG